jgi:hypothetical protein
MKRVVKFFGRVKLFDFLIAFLLFVLAVSFLVFFFRQSKFLVVKLKITEKNVLYAQTTPPYWFVYLFKEGMREVDGLGRTTAEVVEVYFYDSSPTNKAVYLTVKLRTTYNSRTKEHQYKGMTVAVGEGLRINLPKVLAEGLVVEVEGKENPYEEVSLQVRTQLIEERPVFSETTGVEVFVADSIEVGDKVLDSSGKAIAEVLEKEAFPARKITFDDRGNIYQKLDPRLKDVFLKLKVRAKKINNEYYFADDVRIKVDLVLPLHFQGVSIYPTIIEISKI